jgi:exopolysaccharide biosynthesis WecB/TagA/CpsF family protein
MSDAIFERDTLGLEGEHDGSRAIVSGQRVMIYLPRLTMGGAELSMVRLAHGLAAQGACSVSFVLHEVDDCARELAAGLAIAELGVHSTRAALPRLARLLRRERPDVLLAGLTHNNIVAAAAVLLSGRVCRLVLTEHAPVTALTRARPEWRYRVLPRLLPLAYSVADAVVAVSKGVADDLMPLLGSRQRERVQVIYNPALQSGWESLIHASVDDPWFAAGAAPVVLTVGRLSAEKNFALLLDAFVLLRERIGSVRLVIIGEGPERADLQARIERANLSDCVRLLGQRSQVLAYMRRSAVFALTSSFEGFGNVLVEAMAAGIPVVSTDCPVGPSEILENGRYGMLVQEGSPEAMADALARAMTSPGDTDSARQRAQAFTVEHSVHGYRSLFSEIITAKPRGAIAWLRSMGRERKPDVEGKSTLFGMGIDALDRDAAVARILGWLEEPLGPCRYVVTPNVNHVVTFNRSQAFRHAYQNASMVLADSRPIIWASRLLGHPLPDVVPGSDLVPSLFDRIGQKGGAARIFLLGATPDAATAIHHRWPRVTIVGTGNPPAGFEKEPHELEGILAEISAARPDILIIGLGAPRQECFIHSVRHRVDAKVALCIGAAIGALAQDKSPAPVSMRERGLEWLHRVMSEPKPAARHHAHDAPVFPGLLAREFVSTRAAAQRFNPESPALPLAPPFANLSATARRVPMRVLARRRQALDVLEGQMTQLLTRVDAGFENRPARLLQFLGTSWDLPVQDVAFLYASMSARLRQRRVLFVCAMDPGVEHSVLDCLSNGQPLALALQSVSETLSYAAFRGAREPGYAAQAMMADPALWMKLREGFDEVVVASRAPHASQFGLVAASNVDAVMMVVDVERSAIANAREVLDDLRAVKANVFGTVVSRRATWRLALSQF